MSYEIHAHIQMVQVDWWLPDVGSLVLVCTDQGRVTMAIRNNTGAVWIEQGQTRPMKEPVTHWAHTYKINRAIEQYAEEYPEQYAEETGKLWA